MESGLRIGGGVMAAACALAAIIALPATASANERHFTFTYESATLPAGRAEIEPWVTFRHGRQEFYTALDYRLEFEGGITDRLQGSLYFNASTESAGPQGMRATSSAFQGTSVEFKYHFLDSVADPVGLAGYLEMSYGPLYAEIEGKIIADKRVGNLMLALNVVGAHEWNWEETQTEQETEFELDLGIAYFVTPQLSVGIEARNHNNYSDLHGFEYSVVYAGPTVAYAFDRFWVAATVMPQLGALHGATANDFRNLEDHEMVNARLLLGLQL